ncbi:uncharacterized protein ARMOST_11055 [Armillaria ostoyae]|uniref:Uncharacterized protein n=1 Tax=Armillaria ostoyae TaxID=47428 RepID=A0A284RG28_ARMOS|nr:uncharacterized protein ARMOST_11055 [Armillaria ostoyae]
MTTLPPELVEIIVYELWYSEMPSSVRKLFMTTCPRIDRTWKAVYAAIASRDMYITNLAFIDYLCDIAVRKSIIYHDFIPQLTRSIQHYLLRRPQTKCKGKSSEKGLVWIGIGEDPFLPPFRGIPIHARYDRFLYNSSPHHCERCAGKTRMHIYISMIDHAPSVDPCHQIWSYMMCLMRKVGVPQIFFGLTLVSSGPYEVFVIDGIRHLRQITYIPETQLGDWDSRDINQRLWMASRGHHQLGYLAKRSYRREYKCLQSPLPAPFSSKFRRVARTNLLKREILV